MHAPARIFGAFHQRYILTTISSSPAAAQENLKSLSFNSSLPTNFCLLSLRFNMSVTTTDNALAYETAQLLRDYDIHLTGADSSAESNSPAPQNERREPAIQNPPDWPQNFRSIPPHRPINRSLDMTARQSESPVENAFIAMMLHGVWLQATVAQTWRKTGGRLNSNIFRYAIGGEW